MGEQLQNFYTGEKALFIGNGINLLDSKLEWHNLLKNINSKYELDIAISNDKPNPLIFEEMIFKFKKSDFWNSLKLLKTAIAEECNNLKPNKYHGKILDLDVKEIITTNYDYSIEKVFELNFSGENSINKTKEYKYSLKRQNKFKNKRVWHIHGELNNGYNTTDRYSSESIMIGFEHYSDYLRKLHELLKPNEQDKGLIEVLKENDDIWAKLFFTHDMDIIGFSFDFSENHLWWLLNFRARLLKQDNLNQNKIRYIYPDFENINSKSKLELFTALNVELHPIQTVNKSGRDYQEFYDKYLNEYANG